MKKNDLLSVPSKANQFLQFDHVSRERKPIYSKRENINKCVTFNKKQEMT